MALVYVWYFTVMFKAPHHQRAERGTMYWVHQCQHGCVCQHFGCICPAGFKRDKIWFEVNFSNIVMEFIYICHIL